MVKPPALSTLRFAPAAMRFPPDTPAVTPVTLPDTVPSTVLLTKTPMNIDNVTGGTVLLPLRVYQGYIPSAPRSVLLLPANPVGPEALFSGPPVNFGNLW